MDTIDEAIQTVRDRAAKVCETHNVTFIGFFQNSDRSFERMIYEGIEGITPNGSFENSGNNSTVNNTDMQAFFSSLLKPVKVATSSPKQDDSNVSTSSCSTVSNNSESSNPSNSYKCVTIDTNNKVEVKNFLYNCFEEFQQIPCKLLAKAWIKIIEPKKQSKYPYKEGEGAKPYWWPASCVHREPDHLKKDERINLLINILRLFKHKEHELVYTASLIAGLGSKGNPANKADKFGERKMCLLNNMFSIVQAQNDPNVERLRVIKPGKKYSSQLYQRNIKVRARNTHSVLEIGSINTSGKTGTLKYPNISMIPPSINSVASHKTAISLPNFSESYYTEFMDYISNKNNIDKETHLNSTPPFFLGSPFNPRNGIASINRSPGHTLSPLPHSKHSFSTPRSLNKPSTCLLSEDNIDPSFFHDNCTATNTSFRQNSASLIPKQFTPNNSFKIFDFQVSPPPSGIFTTAKVTSPHRQVLNDLNASKINQMHLKLKNATKDARSDKSVLKQAHKPQNKLVKNSNSIVVFKTKENNANFESPETDCEMEI